MKSTILILMTTIVCNINFSQNYKIVDTGQKTFYGDESEITTPKIGESFYGQDAQFNGNQPSYTDNGDGTITDNVTGLMWAKSPDLNGDGFIKVDDKLTQSEAASNASSFNLAGYNDWRLPSIKELYSLIMFYGIDPSGYNGTNADDLVPFMNTKYFDFGFGDTDAGERIIDAQMATSTIYVSTTMNGNETMFRVNFADGRIKGYPTGPMPGSNEGKVFYVYYVRGNTNYGVNIFVDNRDETITDDATDLMWTKKDNGEGVNWKDALAWVAEKNADNYLGHDDWRLPNVKELQSIVDYTRSPATTNSAAIDPLFNCTEITDERGEENYAFYWSSTTHVNIRNGSSASYVCFGEALGNMFGDWIDVHGAGAQRSDPKIGDPNDYPTGHGPQGDAIRIYNYVRLVRDANDNTTGVDETSSSSVLPTKFNLEQNYPNPFNPSTTIEFTIPAVEMSYSSSLQIKIYDILGNKVKTLVDKVLPSGKHKIKFDASEFSSGIYYYQLQSCSFVQTKK